MIADRAWARWVFAFVKNPRDVLARVTAALAPDGIIVLHEYFDYSTWRAMPRCPELEEFVNRSDGELARQWRRARHRIELAALAGGT